MRRAWREFWAAFWRAFEAARQTTPAPVVAASVPVAEAPRAIAWPDSYLVCTLAVECECCGESYVRVTEGWLLDHAGQHLACPICLLPTVAIISYEASA